MSTQQRLTFDIITTRLSSTIGQCTSIEISMKFDCLRNLSSHHIVIRNLLKVMELKIIECTYALDSKQLGKI